MISIDTPAFIMAGILAASPLCDCSVTPLVSVQLSGASAASLTIDVSITNRDERPICYFAIDSGRQVSLTRRRREISWAQPIPHISVRGSRCVMIAPGETHHSEQDLRMVYPDAHAGDVLCTRAIVSFDDDILHAPEVKACEVLR